MSNGEIEGVETRLRDAERWLDMIEDRHERPDEMIVVNEEEFRRLPGAVALYHAGLALAHGDVPETVKYTQRVLDLVPEYDHLGRGGAFGLMGLALWTKGDLETAHRTFAEGMAQLQMSGNISDAVGAYSPWQIYGSHRDVSMMPCVPMSGHYSWRGRMAPRRCAERLICTLE
jgi:LuxR family maltose regulon positive regulatory protein